MNRWRTKIVFAAFCLIVIAGLIASSESFEKCIHNRKEHQAYQALHEEGPLLIKTVVRLELHATCARVTASENDGAIVGLATVVLALFTFALWRATDKLWRSAESQLIEFRRSVDASITASDAAVASAAHASRQSEIMASQRDISIAIQRAWIRVDIKVGGPIRFAHGEVNAEIVVDLLNCGMLPAHADGPTISPYPWGSTEAGSSEEFITRRINIFREGQVVRGAAIFPQQLVSERFYPSLRKSEIDSAVNGLEGFVMSVRGAVRYNYPGSIEVHSTTFHIHILRKPDPNAPSVWRTIPTEDGIIPASELFITNLLGETDAT